MQETPDALFERWSLRGDARALGELFDATAPELLKLALHLVGDAAAAEDLVQATFVAAIEQRERIDATRPVMPWLTGVLAKKAQQHRRRESRPIDLERLRERAAEMPDEQAERRELSAELANALDRVREPFRQVLILRLRHGLEIADIAHVLERSPGTVRVQLHRGLERLRELLPAALVGALAVGLGAPRGLAVVKAGVLAEAGATGAGSGMAAVLGEGLVAKKLSIAAALVLAATLAWWLAARDGKPEENSALAPSTLAQAAPPPNDASSPSLDQSARLPVRESAPREDGVQPRSTGRVIDAETGAPLAGARVAWFAARTTNVRELRHTRDTYFTTDAQGRLVGRTRADWPALIGANDEVFAGRASVLALDAPLPGEEARFRTATDANGSFEGNAQDSHGLLEVALEGYATRWRPCEPGRFPASIELMPERELRARLIGERGQHIAESLELVLSAAITRDSESRDGAAREESPQPLDRSQPEGLGCWRVTTAADGTFRARIGAGDSVQIDVLTPGWKQRLPALITPGEEENVVFLVRTQLWHFFDAASGAPIERVRVLGREQRSGYVIWSGELEAPDGIATPPGELWLWSAQQGAAVAFQAWADGYAPASWIVSNVESSERVEIPLRAGNSTTIAGTVLRAGTPIEGAAVALFGHDPLAWQPDDARGARLVDATTTHRGRFVLQAPPGTYVLRVRDGAEMHSRTVTLPAPQEIAIDLARFSSLAVDVVDPSGAAQPGHVVGLQGSDGRSERLFADERGAVRFERLPPGRYLVMAPHVTTEHGFGADVKESVELAEGETARARLTVMGRGAPRHARVAARGVSSYESWRARYDEGEWYALAVDGTVPMDLATDCWTLFVDAPDGRGWSLDIPKLAPDGYVIELEPGAARLAGEVVGPEGLPIAGLRLEARARSERDVASSVRTIARTDANGRFQLEGLAACEHRLRIYGEENELRAEFAPSAPAGASSPWLRIDLGAPRERARFHGTVRRADGAPAAGAHVHFDPCVAGETGTLHLVSKGLFTLTDDLGRYEIDVLVAPEYRASIYLALGRAAAASEAFASDGRAERTLDFTVP